MRKEMLHLIVMLTCKDQTVENAYEIFEHCKNSKAQYYGCKEKPLPHKEMKRLFSYMKSCGKKTALEVVEYTEEQGVEGARAAVEYGCDILLGTCYYASVHKICKENGIKYMPFLGEVSERPSILRGTAEDMIKQAKDFMKQGVDGFDLLGYRYVGDAVSLNRQVVAEAGAPICLAGSIDSFARLDEVVQTKPWGFTIGSAFFENKFGESFEEQINRVCDYIEERAGKQHE